MKKNPLSKAVARPARASSTFAPSTATPSVPKKRGRPSKARPYQIAGRNGWWANPTLANGMRPLQNFATEDEATDWIAKIVAQAQDGQEPALGGPRGATVAQLLEKYAFRMTINKGGAEAEITRINNYLRGGRLPALRLTKDDKGCPKFTPMVAMRQGGNRQGWQDYVDVRRELRCETYALIDRIGGMKCSHLTTELLGDLQTAMRREGLSESTIQKEIALLKAAFNVAIKEWRWNGFTNPAVGIKLGKSDHRFVRVSDQEEAALVKALSECDNPEFWPLVELGLITTMRRGSLLKMRWSNISLDTGEISVWAKGAQTVLPLSKRAVELLRCVPRDGSDTVFSMSANAVKLAWDGVRSKANLQRLRFADLRHLGATFYAQAGFNPHQLQRVLGHKSTRMAEVYVNLVNNDVREALDRADAAHPSSRQLPPAKVAGRPVRDILAERRTQRLNARPQSNVLELKKRSA